MVQQQAAQPRFKIQRRRQVQELTGKSRSTTYSEISDGLWPPPVRLSASGHSVGWLEHETQAVLAARVASKSDEEIRALVKALVSARKLAA